MRFRGLDLNLLVALDVLLEERNVTRAATRMHVGQSAMSAALARLRMHFEDDLLIVTGKQMVPSALAMSLHAPLQDAIRQIEALVGTERRFIPEQSRRKFVVEMPDHMLPVLLPVLLRRLATEAPYIALELRPSSRDSSQLLAKGELDLVLTPSIYGDPGFVREVLTANTLVVLGCRNNPALQAQPDLPTLLSLQQVIVKFDRSRLAALLSEEQLAVYGGDNRATLIAPNFSCIPPALVGTGRIAILNRRLAEYGVRNFPLVMWQMPLAMPELNDIMMYHPVRQDDAGHSWLRQQMMLAAAALDEAGA